MSDIATPRVLFVPGYGNSGPRHWQAPWQQARPNAELGNLDRPGRTGWVVRLDEAKDRERPHVESRQPCAAL